MYFWEIPVTGKTIVARLIGDMYRDLGLIKKGHIVAVGYEHLVADNIVGLAQLTDEQIDIALDGVFFHR